MNDNDTLKKVWETIKAYKRGLLNDKSALENIEKVVLEYLLNNDKE